MKLGVNTSVWSRAGLSLTEAISQARVVGLKYVDIFGRGHGDPRLLSPNLDLLREFENAIRENNIEIASYCALVPKNPGNELYEEENFNYMLKSIELAARWNCKKVLLDTGEIERGLTAEKSLENLRKLACKCADVAEKMGIFLVIEMEPYSYNLINTPEKAVEFVRKINSSALLINIDTGHLNVMRVSPSQLACVKGLVTHIHVTDNLGIIDSHDEIGLGTTPNAAYLAALESLEFEKTTQKYGMPAVAVMEIHNLLLPPAGTPAPNVQVSRSIKRILEEFPSLEIK